MVDDCEMSMVVLCSVGTILGLEAMNLSIRSYFFLMASFFTLGFFTGLSVVFFSLTLSVFWLSASTLFSAITVCCFLVSSSFEGVESSSTDFSKGFLEARLNHSEKEYFSLASKVNGLPISRASSSS